MTSEPPDHAATRYVPTILGSLTGAAVVVAGVFYVIGVLVTSADLWHAGVSIRDTVSMLPLDQLLSRGVSLVLPVFTILAIATAGLAFYYGLERRFQHRSEREIESIAQGIPADARQEWLADAQTARKKTDWTNLQTLLKRAASSADRPDRKSITRLRRQALVVNLPINLLFLLFLFVVPFLLTPVLSVASVATAIAWVAIGVQSTLRQLLVACAIFLIAFLLNPWLNPRPLPHVTISTDTTGIVRGEFVFLQDGRWFVAGRGGALRVVEPDHVEWATINRSERRRILLEIVTD